MSNKRWKVNYFSHFGTEVDAETKEGAETKALAWLVETYGYDLSRATEFDVEATDE